MKMFGKMRKKGFGRTKSTLLLLLLYTIMLVAIWFMFYFILISRGNIW